MQTLYQLPDSPWKKVCTIIEPKPRRRKVSLQVIFSGIIYLLSNGCKWRSLPPAYGNYHLVWYYLNRWTLYGTLDKVLYVLGLLLHYQQGGIEEPMRVIVRTQAVKTTARAGNEAG